MIKIIFLVLLTFTLNHYAISDETNCDKFKKYSSEYFNCKTEIIKNKAISFGKNFVEDTKEYQKKNYEHGKKQIENTKEQIEKTGEKILKK